MLVQRTERVSTGLVARRAGEKLRRAEYKRAYASGVLEGGEARRTSNASTSAILFTSPGPVCVISASPWHPHSIATTTSIASAFAGKRRLEEAIVGRDITPYRGWQHPL